MEANVAEMQMVCGGDDQLRLEARVVGLRPSLTAPSCVQGF